jgi:hypothetical protein
VRGDAQDVHAAGGVLDDKVRVEPVQADGVEMEEVAGEDAARLRPQELRPGRSGSLGCRIDTGGVQYLPDGGGADRVTESGQLAVDAPVASLGSR